MPPWFCLDRGAPECLLALNQHHEANEHALAEKLIMTVHAVDSIHVGIAGWSYGDWQRTVYPPGTRDKLRYIARYVDAIEINSSFYRTPSRATVESWVERTSDFSPFYFTAKIPREVTHYHRLNAETTSTFLSAFTPMTDAGMLRHLLAQFRWDFEDCPTNRDYLEEIKHHYGAVTNLTFELRHRSWQAIDSLDFLRSLNISVAHLDYPTARNSFDCDVCPVGADAYFRLHGRNSKAWFDKNAGRDATYDYLYSPNEIQDITDRATRIASMSKTLTLVANNHYKGKEIANALQIKANLTGRDVSVPPPLVREYPDLARIQKERTPSQTHLDF